LQAGAGAVIRLCPERWRQALDEGGLISLTVASKDAKYNSRPEMK